MAFENLNYSTDKKIKESIQDKIDNGDIELKHLTKQNLNELKVEILQSNSYLKVRDIEGNIISDKKLTNNNVVDFNGNNVTYKIGSKTKVFLGVNFKDGTEGYISADYVKGDPLLKNQPEKDEATKGETATDETVVEPVVTPPVKKEPAEDTPEVEPVVTPPVKKKPGKIHKEDTPATKEPELDNPISSKEKNTKESKSIGYTKDGKNYIIGANGEPQLLTYDNLSGDFKEGLKDYKESLNKVENLNLLLNALVEKDDENKKYAGELQEITSKFDPTDLDKSNRALEESINKLMLSMKIDNKSDINLDDRVSVLTYIRDELDNYELVRKDITDTQFNNVTKLSDKEIESLIENPTRSNKEIEKIVGKEKFVEIQTKVSEKKAEAEKYIIKYRTEILANNPNVKDDTELEKNIMDAFVGNYAKTVIMENYIDRNESTYVGGYTGKNKELELFSNIQGIGAAHLSDKNANIGWESFKLIATEIVALAAGSLTLGVGTAGVNALVYGARGYKGIKYLQNTAKLANTSLKGATALGKSQIIGAKFGRFAAMSGIEGSAFYAGYGAAQSGFEGKDMYSMEGLGESIAFMGAFKGLNGIYKALGKELEVGVSLSEQKLRLTSQLLAEGTVFAGMGLGFDGKLFEPGEWTAETIIQAFVMAGLFKGMGIAMEKHRFKRKGENDVELVSTEAPTVPAETTTDSAEIKTDSAETKSTEVPKTHDETTTDSTEAPKTPAETTTDSTEAPVQQQQQQTTNHESTNTLSTNKEFMKTVQKDLFKLKDGESVKYGEYKITYKNKEYTVEGPNNYKKDFLNIKSASKDIAEKMGNNSEILQNVFKTGTNEINAKLENLSKSNDGFNIDGKTFRVKKEGSNYNIQEKNGNEGYLDINLNNLTEIQVDGILSKILGKGGMSNTMNVLDKIGTKLKPSKVPLSNLFNKTFWDQIEGSLLKKHGVQNASRIERLLFRIKNNTVGNIIKETKDGLVENTGLKKAFVLRTLLLTGRNSNNLYRMGDSGILPTAWMPSWTNLGLMTTLGVVENYSGNFSEKDYIGNAVEILWFNSLIILYLERETIIDFGKEAINALGDEYDNIEGIDADDVKKLGKRGVEEAIKLGKDGKNTAGDIYDSIGDN